MYTALKAWPRVLRSPDAITGLNGRVIGSDFEWDVIYNRPTIIGVSDDQQAVSCPYGDGIGHFKALLERYPQAMVVGHNYLSADLQLLNQQGIKLDPARVDDSMLWWWLTHPNLCKTTKKDADDEAERRGAGFMSIYPMCSVFTNLPNWKICRGPFCEGPCPECDVFGYNGLDALVPVLALPRMKELARLRGVDRLYPLHRDLMVALAEMNRVGVMTSRPQIEHLRATFEARKLKFWNKATGEGIVRYAGGEVVNLDSWQQLKKYFTSEHGITLPDTTEETVRKYARDYPGCQELQWLNEWKAAGDGPDRWLADRVWNSKRGRWQGFVHPDGSIHCHLGPWTSSGRLNCAGPNLQNVEVRTEFGKEVRKAFVPREGLAWFKADYKAAEYRVFLHMAGHRDLPEEDFHEWCGHLMGLIPTDPIVIKEGGIRRAAKTITFGTQYLEGLQLKDPDELKRGRVADEIRMGARLVFKDWLFQDKVVTFTGVNLARRAFGEASWANRKRALEFQERFFSRFPKIRPFQKQITRQIERECMVSPPTGYRIPSYGFPEDRIKTAMAIFGSNPVAHFTKHAILRARDAGALPLLQVHDELSWESARPPQEMAAQIKEIMVFELPEMPGLKLPVDVGTGTSWGACKSIDEN